MYYIDETRTSCEDCFQLQKLDSLKLCDMHTEEEVSGHIEPNFAVLLIEGLERGVFTEKFFATQELLSHLPSTTCEQLKISYFPTSLQQKDRTKRMNRISTSTRYQQTKARSLQAIRNRLSLDLDCCDSVLLKVVYFLLEMKYLNTTVICHSKTGEEINAIGGIFQQYGLRPKLTSKDATMISVSLPDKFGIRVINNFQYFRQDIEDLNSTFAQLDLVMFPYKMNQPIFYGYNGPMPSSENFTSMFSTAEEIVKSVAYVSSRQNCVWNFGIEILKYARFEVRVLAHTATSFVTEAIDFQRSLIIDCELVPRPPTDAYFEILMPYSRPYCTIASYSFDCMKLHTIDTSQLYVWKKEFGFGQASGNPSIEELEYVSYIMHKVGPEPRYHYSFSSEAGQMSVVIDGVKVMFDLYYEDSNGKVHIHEMCGCNCHPHPNCLRFPLTGKNGYNQDRSELIAKDNRRRDLIERHFGERLVLTEMYSCFWKKLKQSDTEVKRFMDSYVTRPQQRLVPRKAVRGGQTETYIHSYSALEKPNLVMESIDCVSLYPWAAVNHAYPVGEYRVLLSRDDLSLVHLRSDGHFYVGSDRLYGLMQVCMKPPAYTQFPCLLFRNDNERSIAGLCFKCIMEESENICRHEPQNRWLSSTWTVIEVEYAVRQGYEVLQIFEVYAYKRAERLLSTYFRFCGSLKIKNSGLPSGIEDKYDYCSKLNSAMSLFGALRVTPGNCVKSPVRRQVCKSMMNEAIGKFSSYNRPKQSHFACTSQELKGLLEDTKYLVEQIIPINDSVMQVVRRKIHEVRSTNVRSCSIIHAYLTAYSRLHMISVMERLEEANVRVASIDCDGLKVLREKNCDLSKIIDIGSHFGAFRRDLAPYVIFDYCSLAPRVNSVLMAGPDGDIKARTQMTSFSIQSMTLQQSLNHSVYVSMLKDRIMAREKKLLISQRRFFRRLLKYGKQEIKDYTFSNMIALKRVTYMSKSNLLVTRPLGTSIHLEEVKLCAKNKGIGKQSTRSQKPSSSTSQKKKTSKAQLK